MALVPLQRLGTYSILPANCTLIQTLVRSKQRNLQQLLPTNISLVKTYDNLIIFVSAAAAVAAASTQLELCLQQLMEGC
jgi:hypothetical protein